MSVFIIVSKTDNAELGRIIQEKYPQDYYQYSSNQWLVSSSGISKEVSDNLGISDKDKNLVAVVFAISSYWGRASADVWDWLKNKLEEGNG